MVCLYAELKLVSCICAWEVLITPKYLCFEVIRFFTYTLPHKLMNKHLYSLHVYVTLIHTNVLLLLSNTLLQALAIPAPCHCQNAAHMFHQNTVFPAKPHPGNYKKSCIQGISQESYLCISIMKPVYFTQLIQTYLNDKVFPSHTMKPKNRSIAPVNLNLDTRQT